jgi:hypothetical protein
MSRQKSRQNKAIYFNQSLIGSNPNGSLLKLSSKKNVASQHYSMKTHSTLEGLSEEEKKEILLLLREMGFGNDIDFQNLPLSQIVDYIHVLEACLLRVLSS